MKSKTKRQIAAADKELAHMPTVSWRDSALYQRQRKLRLELGLPTAHFKLPPEVRAYLRSRTASRKR